MLCRGDNNMSETVHGALHILSWMNGGQRKPHPLYFLPYAMLSIDHSPSTTPFNLQIKSNLTQLLLFFFLFNYNIFQNHNIYDKIYLFYHVGLKTLLNPSIFATTEKLKNNTKLRVL